MKRFLHALVYTGLAALANPGHADIATAEAARAGDMKKLSFADPAPVGSSDFQTFDGDPVNLSDYAGKWVLVNFWATWCAPCRKEMPMLSQLQRDLGGENFEVVTIATGRNSPQGMKAFFEEVGVDNLPLHRDPGSILAREMSVLGLPITVILNPEGQEIARLRGDADWASDSAKAVLSALILGS
jgi:thiol-disulfide isomerase/thioredoxin